MKKRISELFSQMRTLKHQAGFTMIELLIVISILGILAVAVLSAINPIEQINRGRDTGSRSDAEQLLSAMDRFNAFQGYYPWKTGAGDLVAHADIESSLTLFDDVLTVYDTGGTCPISDKLSATEIGGCTGADELKITFFNRIFDSSYNPLFIYNEGGQGDSTYVCFVPKSKAFITEAQKRCVDIAGSGLPSDLRAQNGTICPGALDSDAADVYICLP